ncbi:MAG: PfkB family carbohydrate kinase [Actinomycetaceae bacterium]|nr:PfkB family carbohydrate kinase [Actinomycetaceae bacterium]MDY6083562.1 PfkB family carbohydrate kinase [Actinomycetaceae bacterium]
MSIVVIGESLMDEIVSPSQTIRRPGGSPYNTAIALGKLERNVTLVTDFGNDDDGSILASQAQDSHVSLWMRPAPQRTDATMVAHSVADDAPYAESHSSGSIQHGSGSLQLDFRMNIIPFPQGGTEKINVQLLAPHAAAFGFLAAHMKPCDHEVREWIRNLRQTATIFYSPHVPTALFPDLPVLRATIEENVKLADIVTIDGDALAAIYPHSSYVEITARWFSAGAQLIIITLGADGVRIYPRGGSSLAIPVFPLPVIDTSGARDAFLAGLIDGITRSSLDGAANRDMIARAPSQTLAMIGSYAATAASISVTHHGVRPPTREELSEQYILYGA